MAPHLTQVHAKHDAWRKAAFDSAKLALSMVAPAYGQWVTFTPIGDPAILAWQQAWAGHTSPYGDGDFNWDKLRQAYQNRPKRFEVAIWYGPMLCGMVLGEASNGPRNLNLHFLEAFHGINPLKGQVAFLACDLADRYAKILGKQYVRLRQPVQGARPLYQRLGFTIASASQANTYFERPVA